MKEHFCLAEKSIITYQGECSWCGESEKSMTQDDIIRFAIQCRLVTTGNRDGLYMDALTEFANLVAAKEREACAKVSENCGAIWVAKAIRARGQA